MSRVVPGSILPAIACVANLSVLAPPASVKVLNGSADRGMSDRDLDKAGAARAASGARSGKSGAAGLILLTRH